MFGIGHELLPEAEHFQRRAPDPGKWLGRAIDQKPLRGLADPQRRPVAQPFARQPLDAQSRLDQVATSNSVVTRLACRFHCG